MMEAIDGFMGCSIFEDEDSEMKTRRVCGPSFGGSRRSI